MATITLVHDKRYESKNGVHPVVVCVHHQGKRKYIKTGIKLPDSQFADGKVKNHVNAKILNAQISSKVGEIEKYIANCQLNNKPIHLDLIGTNKNSYSFIDYLTHRAEQYRQKGQIVMDRKLRCFAKELTDCFERDILFEDINADMLRDFEAYLIRQGNVNNTRAKKFKFLRQFFGQAIDEGKTDGRNPFKFYNIPIKPVKKDKLTAKDIAKIESLNLTDGPVNDTRNLFLFSYYAKGARFENCVTLHHSQIKNGRISIRTNKGGKFITVKIHSRLQKLLNKYRGKGLVFPFISDIPEDPKTYLETIASCNTVVNRNLKIIAALCKIKNNLTFHIARHTFADHLKSATGNINIIQDSLGHSDQRTTQIYLKSLGDEILDKEMDKLYGK